MRLLRVTQTQHTGVQLHPKALPCCALSVLKVFAREKGKAMTLGLTSRNTVMKDRPIKYFTSRNQIEEHCSWDMPTKVRAFFTAFLKGSQ